MKKQKVYKVKRSRMYCKNVPLIFDSNSGTCLAQALQQFILTLSQQRYAWRKKQTRQWLSYKLKLPQE